ncbi:MAG: pantetheine-phosphate adenylyltransferase [Bacteroidota bacterium]|nr:pantetheine-phosphate adenylyltransferase [Bacteroidota bacterium]
MEKIAVFPGSFDPFTIGHESIVTRSLELFDKIVIAVGNNENKKCFFPLQARMAMIREVFAGNPKIEVSFYDDLTVAFCKRVNAKYILRGLRTSADFEYERAIAQVNKMMYNEVESVFILTLPEHTSINSSIVREVLKHGGDVSRFLPHSVDLKKYL